MLGIGSCIVFCCGMHTCFCREKSGAGLGVGDHFRGLLQVNAFGSATRCLFRVSWLAIHVLALFVQDRCCIACCIRCKFAAGVPACWWEHAVFLSVCFACPCSDLCFCSLVHACRCCYAAHALDAVVCTYRRRLYPMPLRLCSGVFVVLLSLPVA